MMMKTMSFALALLIVPAVFAGCASSKITSDTPLMAGDNIAKPARVIVWDFAATPADIPASSPASRLYETRSTPQSAKDVELGRQLGTRIADQLVEDIRAMGLAAERDDASLPPQEGDLIIRGELVSIDEGSRVKRMLIGFGSGAVKLETLVEVYQIRGQGLHPLGSSSVEAGGGKLPGMIVPVGIGAAAGSAATSAVVSGAGNIAQEVGPESLEAAADRTASAISERLKVEFVNSGWIDG
jgi:hypothetical protein